MKDKAPEVKIIQAFSHCENTQGGGYIHHAYIYGLGDDGKIYLHNKYRNAWQEPTPNQ